MKNIIKKSLVLGAILAIPALNLVGCAHHLEIVTSKLPGKEHRPNPAMAGAGQDNWRQQLYYPSYTYQTR